MPSVVMQQRNANDGLRVTGDLTCGHLLNPVPPQFLQVDGHERAYNVHHLELEAGVTLATALSIAACRALPTRSRAWTPAAEEKLQ